MEHCLYFNFHPKKAVLTSRSSSILKRAERLKTFGDEPKIWYGLLQPVLKEFVQTFDTPDSEDIRGFWQKIAHYSGGGSGPTYLSGRYFQADRMQQLTDSGWITAFCFWDARGKCFHDPGHNPSHGNEMLGGMGEPTPVLTLDTARYHRIDSQDVPSGYAVAPIIMDYNGREVKAEMVAGSMGMRLSASDKNKEGSFDTMQPGSGWWMYTVKYEK